MQTYIGSRRPGRRRSGGNIVRQWIVSKAIVTVNLEIENGTGNYYS